LYKDKCQKKQGKRFKLQTEFRKMLQKN